MTYLSVEKTIDERYEESLEGGEKVSSIGPDCKVGGRFEGSQLVEEIGDSQQRQKDNGGPNRLSGLLNVTGLRLPQFDDQDSNDINQETKIQLPKKDNNNLNNPPKNR